MDSKPFESFTSLLAVLDAKYERDRVALTFYRGKTRMGRLTYGELLDRVHGLSGYLQAALDVHPGDRILILAPNRLEIPVLLLALMRIGAVVVPLNPTATPEDWKYIARHSEAKGLIATRELQDRFGQNDPDFEFTLDIDELSGFSGKIPDSIPKLKAVAEIHSDELAIVLYTSGTTGNPKGVGLSQRNLLANAWSMALNFNLMQTTQFAVLPLYHAHALGFGLMTSLITGGHLVFTDKMDPFAWAEIIRGESVSFTSVVPNLLSLLLAARVHREKVPTLKSILVSSAPLSVEQARDFETKTGIPLIQGWGLSEYTNFACCLSPTDTPEDHRALLFSPEGSSIGSPLTGTEVRVIDEKGQEAPEGMNGELCVRGHSLMLAYYRDFEATRNTLHNGWLRTGDQGLFRRYQGKPVFFITGRIKEIIIRSGEKYSPLAIEKKICDLAPEFVGKLVVVGFSHRLQGEEIGAYLETDHLTDPLRDRLTKTIEALPIELRPKVILCSSTPIPRTHTGKIQRRKLHSLFSKFDDCRGALKIETVENEVRVDG